MARIVMKFGGTSVANVERIRNVAAHVKREVDAGNRVAVVVSAMSGATNQLVAWVRGIRVRRPDISQADAVEVALGCLANEAWDVTGDLHLQRSKLASERWTLEFRDDSDARYKVRVDLKGVAAVVEAMPEEAP